MIKEFCLIGILLILVLAICILSQWYIVNSADDIRAALAPVAQAIDDEDWEKADAGFAIAKNKWEKTQKIWKIIINHEDMKDVELSFVDMEAILKQEHRDPAKKELETLMFFINHVPENDKLNLGNFF